ncbi:hypothetical protein DL98DRAFT_519488 [Cadophora sp. DSE1049]|nr:hypothetical protein DL98DRAFT_519488 [Cadophora sp. DSE1049]
MGGHAIHAFGIDTSNPNIRARFKIIHNDKVIATKAIIVDSVAGRVHEELEVSPKESASVSTGIAELVREHIKSVQLFQKWILAFEEQIPIADDAGLNQLATLLSQSFTPAIDPETQQRDLLVKLLWSFTHSPEETSRMYQDLLKNPLFEGEEFKSAGFVSVSHLPEAQLLPIIIATGIAEAYDRIRTIAIGDIFIWTTDGLCGTAPVATEERDAIALIPGIQAPMILRLVQANSYRVIGPAFIYGMMFGEKWKRRKDGDSEKEDEDNNVCDIFLE